MQCDCVSKSLWTLFVILCHPLGLISLFFSLLRVLGKLVSALGCGLQIFLVFWTLETRTCCSLFRLVVWSSLLRYAIRSGSPSGSYWVLACSLAWCSRIFSESLRRTQQSVCASWSHRVIWSYSLVWLLPFYRLWLTLSMTHADLLSM